MPMTKDEEIDYLLGTCKKILNERGKEYNGTYRCFEVVGRLWGIYLNEKEYLNDDVFIDPKEVAMMMVLFKFAREMMNHKDDNIIDSINYTLLYQTMLSDHKKEYNAK